MLNPRVVSEGLIRLTHWFGCHEIWDCCMAFIVGPIFEEAYAIRAALVAERALGIGQARQVACAFCDRALETQGVTEENMYYMGYANQRNAEGMPACSCVADASSSAQAILDTIQAHPDSPRRDDYLASLRRFLDYVLDRYRTPQGVIGVGILSFKRNPWPEYWCANALFTPILIGVGEITGETKYLDAAVAPLEFLARFDYRKESTWAKSPTELIAYTSEGLLAGLLSQAMQDRLRRPPAGVVRGAAKPPESATAVADDAPNRIQNADRASRGGSGDAASVRALLEARWAEFAEWLYRHQDVNGVWQDPKDYRAYQLMLSWTLLRACRGLGTHRHLERCVERQLAHLVSPEAKTFFGLFCRPFATANAWLSFAHAAEVCRAENPHEFAKALADAEARTADRLW